MADTITATPKNNVIPDDPRFVAAETVPGEPMAQERDKAQAGGMHWAVRALAAGVTGAAVVTALNEAGRRLVPQSPRMDLIGGRAVAKTAGALGLRRPEHKERYRISLAGDLLSNSAYYALAAAGGRRSIPAGGAIGLAAGAGAAWLPKPLGLGRQPDARGALTPALTVTWYTLAGLAAGAVARLLGPKR